MSSRNRRRRRAAARKAVASRSAPVVHSAPSGPAKARLRDRPVVRLIGVLAGVLSLVVGVVALWPAFEGLQRDDLRVQYATSLANCTKVVTRDGHLDLEISAYQSALLSNVGRMPITVLDFAPTGGTSRSLRFQWLAPEDGAGTVHEEEPVVLQAGQSVAVRVWSASGTILYPFAVWRSDGKVLQAQIGENRTLDPPGVVIKAYQAMATCPNS